ncbi:MAG: hypothetical protein IKZ07_00830 [Akkermansia sp.]|nr:hypothetical protein [Akkermansia sp.]
MLASIAPLIARGVIDNTLQDLIDLRLWCTDGAEPLHLRMQGNCRRDIAGCRLEFTNTSAGSPPANLPSLIHELRNRSNGAPLCAGDITFSRRAVERNNRQGISNRLYIEFFVGVNTRVLLEFNAVDFDLSLPQWEPTWEGDNMQAMLNLEALRSHVRANVKSYKGPALYGLNSELPDCDWDYRLNRAEAYMAIYPTIKDKFATIPGGYISAAFVMDRTDFLGKIATEDEADMPPDRELIENDWEVVDFMTPYEKEMKQAMHHPLFTELAAMTALVQSKLIQRYRPELETGPHGAAFLQLYATLVTHTLATILLTGQNEYPAHLATRRMEILCARLNKLSQLTEYLPADCRQELRLASDTLMHNMRLFIATIPN